MSQRETFDLSKRHLYLCTSIRDDLTAFVSDVVRGGVDIVQLREKTATARAIVSCATELRKVTSDLGVPFIINDRPDIALEVGADGVHVGQDDVDVSLVRKILPAAIVGLSTHSSSELEDSLLKDADYISAGPIVPTPTKPGRSGTGIGYVQKASALSPKPVFATGAVQPAAIPELVTHGVRHFVVVRYLTQSDNPYRSALELRTAIDRALDA